MRTAEALTGHLMETMMAFDPHHEIGTAETIAALLFCLMTIINSAPDETTRVQMAVDVMRAIIDDTEADVVAALMEATGLALSDVAGNA